MRNEKNSSSWIDSEFSTLDFGDKRLTNRFLSVARRLMANPESSLNQAMKSRAELKAAYRFFKNERVDVNEILASHHVELVKRIQDEKVVLAIQDTSLLVYSGHKKTQGLGELGRIYTSGDRGLLLHSCLAVSSEGIPLGIFSHHCWARDRPFDKSDCRMTRRGMRQSMTAGEKESIKWVDSLEQSMKVAHGSCTRIVTVADREADYNFFMGTTIEMGGGFVIRARTNRVIHDYKSQRTTLRDKLAIEPVRGTTKIKVSKHENKINQDITLMIKFFPFNLHVSDKNPRYGCLPDIWDLRLWAVEAEEAGSNKHNRLHWILLTTEPIRTVEDAKKIIGWYKMRWTIETYFKVLKSGLRIEECRLGSAERLFRYISLMAVIGYRVLYLSRFLRRYPDCSCREIFSQVEIAVLNTSFFQKSDSSSGPLTANESIRLVARLGGYQNRKTDPPPGPIPIWKGLKALNERVQLYELITKAKEENLSFTV